MSLGPRVIVFQDVITGALGSLVAGFLGSLMILIITFFASNYINIEGQFADAALGVIKTKAIFPLVLSMITFVGSMVAVIMTYNFLHFTDPEKYKKNGIILSQVSFFSLMTYMFFTPLYVYGGLEAYENIMYVFIFHILIVIFGLSIILEVMNNYRYILIGIYGSFIGLFISSLIALILFTIFPEGAAKLVALIILLPIINFSLTFFKQSFELLYYQYYLTSGQDRLGDIFYQIKLEEEEVLKVEEEKNLI